MNREHESGIKSVNIHLTGECNYRCRFCFSRDGAGKAVMDAEGWKPILRDLICVRGISKVNFAGGEPLLHPDLKECIRYCKQLGATTSVVTNGSLVTEGFLKETSGCLDWIGLSVDSADEETEVLLGRHTRGCRHLDNVVRLAGMARSLGFHVKLNITVTRQSADDDFHDLIRVVEPDRVKFLQVTGVPGTNDRGHEGTSVPDDVFGDVVERHKDVELPHGFRPVFETCDDIRQSYLMLDSRGRVRVGTQHGYTYIGYDEYSNGNIRVDTSRYLRRGGLYDWTLQGKV